MTDEIKPDGWVLYSDEIGFVTTNPNIFREPSAENIPVFLNKEGHASHWPMRDSSYCIRPVKLTFLDEEEDK